MNNHSIESYFSYFTVLFFFTSVNYNEEKTIYSKKKLIKVQKGAIKVYVRSWMTWIKVYVTPLQYVYHLVLSALPIRSPPFSTNLSVTVWSHISLQKCLHTSASGIILSLCVSSNSLNNLFWFDSNMWFCL